MCGKEEERAPATAGEKWRNDREKEVKAATDERLREAEDRGRESRLARRRQGQGRPGPLQPGERLLLLLESSRVAQA